MTFNRFFVAISTLLLSSGLSAADVRTDFVPRIVFGGYSQGDGQSKLFFKPARSFHVESHGYDLPDGTFRLDQATAFSGQPTTTRFWVIRNVGQNKFVANLSDSPGLVTGIAEGGRLLLHYRVKGPFVLHQQLDLMPDGKTISNVGRITFLGIPIGWVHETITRKD